MTIQSITDLSEDQENERYSRLKKSLLQLAAASLAIALTVYFSYSSSPWRYVPIVVLASAAVLLIVSAIMARPVETEESSHTIDLNLITDSIRNSINESNERMYRIMNKETTRSPERERSHNFLREYNLQYNFRESDFILHTDIEVIQNGNKLHKLYF